MNHKYIMLAIAEMRSDLDACEQCNALGEDMNVTALMRAIKRTAGAAAFSDLCLATELTERSLQNEKLNAELAIIGEAD